MQTNIMRQIATKLNKILLSFVSCLSLRLNLAIFNDKGIFIFFSKLKKKREQDTSENSSLSKSEPINKPHCVQTVCHAQYAVWTDVVVPSCL